MTTNKGALGDGDKFEQGVVEYLRSHTDFFGRHPELLEELTVPHSCGGAVSLVEYQVSVLRDQNHDLRRRMQRLVNNARDNEKLSQRMHRLTLGMIECASLDEVFANLYQALSEDFKAEFAAARVFRSPTAAADRGLGEFVADDADARQLFEPVLQSSKPVCGRVRPEQMAYVFADQSAEIESGALVPLRDHHPIGVVAIGSRDPQRFRPGMGTVFLRQLGEVVSRVIAPHIVAK